MRQPPLAGAKVTILRSIARSLNDLFVARIRPRSS